MIRSTCGNQTDTSRWWHLGGVLKEDQEADKGEGWENIPGMGKGRAAQDNTAWGNAAMYCEVEGEVEGLEVASFVHFLFIYPSSSG